MPDWLNVEIAGTAAWPAAEKTVRFEGQELLLKPATPTTSQSIHVDLSRGLDETQALTLINRFLSLVCWCDDQPIENRYGWSGSPVPVTIPRSLDPSGSSVAFPSEFSISRDRRAILALALYREGRNINSTAFAFLSYFKILNIFWKDRFKTVQGVRSNPIVDGIRSTLPNITNEQAALRIQTLKSAGLDVAEYLYESCRCAVAHANIDPVADPDNLADIRRLAADVWIIKAISEKLMTNELSLSRRLFQ